MATWITDMTDIAPAGADVPEAARLRSEFTRAVVEAATSRRVEGSWCSAVRCVGHHRKKKCSGMITVERSDDEVQWSCGECGEGGVVSHFRGTASDLSAYAPRGKTVLWGFDEQERKVLVDATTEIPELRAIVARGRIEPRVVGVFLVEATVAELNEVYSLVEELTDCTRSRRRIDLLDGLRASLCTSMDGF
jgi:hypothetical protein